MDLKLSSNLFLGLQETNHLKNSLKTSGFEKILRETLQSTGIIRTDTAFTSLQVIGGSIGSISVKAGMAVDNNINIIDVPSNVVDAIAVPNDNITRYIVIKYSETVIEEGTINVQSDGVIVGTGTQFISRLRGLPNFASKIVFPTSTLNTSEYIIQAIQSDTLGSLNVAAGQIVAETNLKYAVVGTFTPGIAIPTNDKYPFITDSYTIEIRTNDTVVAGEEFVLAEVSFDGVTMTIVDRRLSDIFQYQEEFAGIESQTNLVAGIESIKYDSIKSSREKNLIKVGWGLDCLAADWTISTNTLTALAFKGGVWSDYTSMVSGDLNGWRVVFADGTNIKIITSINTGSEIELLLESQTAYPTTGDIVIVPNATIIELEISNVTNPTANNKLTFSASSRSATFLIEGGTQSIIKFRHVLGLKTNTAVIINNGSYLNETSFNDNGVQIASNTTAVVSGQVTPLVNVNNLYNRVPPGLIATWSGSLGTIPTGWQLCDGTNGTPNLRDKFLIGAGTTYAVSDVGGEATHTLITTEIPAHVHYGGMTDQGVSTQGDANITIVDVVENYAGSVGAGKAIGFAYGTDSGYDNIYLSNSTGSGDAHNNLPPYYALAFIQKIA
jgi:microcystin-dependent protein